MLSGIFVASAGSDMNEMQTLGNPEMIVIDARRSEIAAIIILVVDAESALVPQSILAYQSLCAEHVKRIVLVCAVQVFEIRELLQFDHQFGACHAADVVAAEAVLHQR